MHNYSHCQNAGNLDLCIKPSIVFVFSSFSQHITGMAEQHILLQKFSAKVENDQEKM